MSKLRVAIIDYGVGNMLSVQRAVEHCGAEAFTSSEAGVVARANRVILPGVGAFANGMKALEALGLVDVIRTVIADGVPLLGICLGMQLLFEESEEHGITKGLGVIPGRVVPIPNMALDGTTLKIPHIGWNSIVKSGNVKWKETILQSLTPGDSAYFLHSYMAKLENPAMGIAECFYGGNRISSVVQYRNVFGCQFHPEKSQNVGLQLFKNFLK